MGISDTDVRTAVIPEIAEMLAKGTVHYTVNNKLSCWALFGELLQKRFSVVRRSPPYPCRGSRTANRPAACANREPSSLGRIVAPFRQGQAQPDGGIACTRR